MDFQENNLIQQKPCPQIWSWNQEQNPKVTFVHMSTLLYSCPYIYISTHRFPGRFSRACYTIHIYIYFSMVVGYDGVGFAQGPASLRRSILWLGLYSALFWCRICDYRDAVLPSYPLIMCWRCRDLNFRSMLWYGVSFRSVAIRWIY